MDLALTWELIEDETHADVHADVANKRTEKQWCHVISHVINMEEEDTVSFLAHTSSKRVATLVRVQLATYSNWTMNACDAVNDWSSDGENGLTSIMTQILKPNPLDTQQPIDAASCDPPARNYRSCVPYADWILGESYIEQPPNCIHTALEWKFTFNNRGFAKQTEEELVVALSDFWDEELSLKIEEIAKTLSKPCKADSTTVVMSGNGRSETDITKTFKELQINWPIAEKQLHAWSHLLHIGKWLKINVSFKYVESGKTGRSAGRATGAQLADREVRLNAELATLDGPVYQVMKCPGPPCDRGPYCWQDSVSKKHYKLLGHHLRSLVRFV